MLVVILLLLITLYLTRIRIELRATFRREAGAAPLELEVRGPLFRWRGHTDVEQAVRTALDHMWRRWRGTGEPVRIPLQKTLRRMPGDLIQGAVGSPLRYLGHRLEAGLELSSVVGGADAAESALLAGLTWSVLGSGLGVAAQWVPSVVRSPRIEVKPDYARPACEFDLRCIARFRAAHAIITAVWLSLRVARRPELMAWLRDSLRRKGDVGGNGASNPGPDEDGHGVN